MPQQASTRMGLCHFCFPPYHAYFHAAFYATRIDAYDIFFCLEALIISPRFLFYFYTTRIARLISATRPPASSIGLPPPLTIYGCAGHAEDDICAIRYFASLSRRRAAAIEARPMAFSLAIKIVKFVKLADSLRQQPASIFMAEIII